MNRAQIFRTAALVFVSAATFAMAGPVAGGSGAMRLRGAGEEITVRDSRDDESALERAAREARARRDRERDVRGEDRDGVIWDRDDRDRDRDIRDRDTRERRGRGHAYGTDPAWHAAKDARKAEKKRMKEIRKAEAQRDKEYRKAEQRREKQYRKR